MTKVLRALILVTLCAGAAASSEAPRARDSALPNRADSVKFAVIGDGGTGNRPQFDVAARMEEARKRLPYDLVLMVGDNFYGSQKDDADLRRAFDAPYKRLLDAGVVFQAVLGNHDDPRTVRYRPLNMADRRYYSFVRGHVRFIGLDTNVLDRPQVQWLERTLSETTEPWKIAYFHHPLYSNGGRHGASVDVRVLLEPLLVRYGVSVVFSGHDHHYERLTPQRGIHYFVCGAAGKLRKGGLERATTTAAGFDEDQSFLIAEISGSDMFFEAISRTGVVVDEGRIPRRAGPMTSDE